MSIPNVNLTYISPGGVTSGSPGILAFGGQSCLELSYIGTATFVGDAGNSVSAILNFIDGTNTLPWTPTAVTAEITNTNTANLQLLAVTSVTGINATACTVNFTQALGSTKIATILFQIFK